MKKSLSIKAMLIGLFLAAVVGALILAATGLISTQRLVDSQRYITGEVLPQQAASRSLASLLGEYAERHTKLLSAESAGTIEQMQPREALNERFGNARQQLAQGDAGTQTTLLATLDAEYRSLLEADEALETVRHDQLALDATMESRIVDMQAMIGRVLSSAEDMAGRATLAEVRAKRDIGAQIAALQQRGLMLVPASMVSDLLDGRLNIAQVSGNVQTSVALLADLGRRLMQVDSSDALVDLRYNQIAQQITSTRQALESIAAAPHANAGQLERAEALTEALAQLDQQMITGGDSVYALRQQQLDLQLVEQAALTAVGEAMAGMREVLGQVESHSVAAAERAAASAEATAQAGRLLQGAVTVLVILLLAVFGWRTLVRVLGPLGQMRQQMENISGSAGADGDLSMRLALGRRDEIGRTAEAFNEMMTTFEGIILRIRDGAGAIAANSRQISAGNQDLSQRTEQQSASLAETASSLEQITATVKQTAEYAHQARDVSGQVDKRARSTGEVAERTNSAMIEIREASEKITTIVKAIDDIAFQTNLLALNASVEAARAGEQGRGFAVVAEEVRRLAQRSADEAAQIRQLIDDSVNKVSEGSKLVEATSSDIKTIIESLVQVANYVTEIADATQEQSIGIEQINQAIAQLDQVTHQNARLVQEASTNSQALDEQAADMHALVGRFKVSAESSSLLPALPGIRQEPSQLGSQASPRRITESES